MTAREYISRHRSNEHGLNTIIVSNFNQEVTSDLLSFQ